MAELQTGVNHLETKILYANMIASDASYERQFSQSVAQFVFQIERLLQTVIIRSDCYQKLDEHDRLSSEGPICGFALCCCSRLTQRALQTSLLLSY